MKRSTGFRNYVLASGSVANALKNTVILIYGGTVPVDADSAVGSATLLCTISVNATGTPLTMNGTAVDGVLGKNQNEIWRGVVTAAGQATFFRQQLPSDTGAASTQAVRIQGTIGLVGSELDFNDTLLQVGDERKINSYVVALTAG